MSTNNHNCTEHSVQYDKVINIYKKDDIDNTINLFIVENNILFGKEELIKEIKKKAIYIGKALEILDDKYITCIGARIYHNDKEFSYDIESILYNDIIKQKCYLLNMWRDFCKCNGDK